MIMTLANHWELFIVHHKATWHNLTIHAYLIPHESYAAYSAFYFDFFIQHTELDYQKDMLTQDYWIDFAQVNYPNLINLTTIEESKNAT